MMKLKSPHIFLAVAILLFLLAGGITVRRAIDARKKQSGDAAKSSSHSGGTGEVGKKEGAVTFTGKGRSEITVKDVMESSGDYPAPTRTEIEHWITKHNGSKESWMAALACTHNYEARSEILDRALRAHPNSVEIVYLAALRELNASEDDVEPRTRNSIDRLLKMDPDNGLFWLVSSIWESEKKDKTLAIEHFVRASQADEIRLFEKAFSDAAVKLMRSAGFSEGVTLLSGIAGGGELAADDITDTASSYNFVQKYATQLEGENEIEKAQELYLAGFRVGQILLDAEGVVLGGIMSDSTAYNLQKQHADKLDLSSQPSELLKAKIKMEADRQQMEAIEERFDNNIENASNEDFIRWIQIASVKGYMTATLEMGW